MADLGALLAQAFDVTEAAAATDVEVSTTAPTPPSVPPPVSAFVSNYAEPMRNIIRFLLAVENTPAGGSFANIWAATALPATVAELTTAMQRVYSLPAKQLTDVFQSLTNEQRQYFHVQSISLSELVKNDMSELSLAVALLRWLMQAALPTLQSFPEETALQTGATLRKNYAAIDYAARIAKPEEPANNTAELQKMSLHISTLEKQLADQKQKYEKTAAALMEHQNKPTPMPSPAVETTKYKSTAITLGVILAIITLILIVLVVLYIKKCQPSIPQLYTGGGMEVPQTAPAMLGGVGAGHSNVDINFPTEWGFRDLV